ncbi:MAG: ThiF family adenylyltransferase [Candidatus Micrarchaeota archaeon]
MTEDKFDRQKRVEGWDQQAVERQRVCIVGAGALGNEIVKLLAQLGVKELALIDYDQVTHANLNRCVFFTEKDAAEQKLKTQAISEGVKRISAIQIKPIEQRIEFLPDGFYGQFDVVFSGLDNLGARLHLNAHCYGKTFMIDGGTTGFHGKVQSVLSPSACVECGFTKRDYKLLWKKYSCVGEVLDYLNPAMPALATTTSIIAGLQVNEFIKFAHGKKEELLVGKYLFVDGLKNEFSLFDIPKRKNCPVHGT